MDKRGEVVIIKLIKGEFMVAHSKRQVVSLFPKRDRAIRLYREDGFPKYQEVNFVPDLCVSQCVPLVRRTHVHLSSF
jgi:hypothetical protein